MIIWLPGIDHDFGLNDAGKEYPFKKQSKAMFRSFWKLGQAIPATRDGIYYARRFVVGQKNIQIIMLDVRYNRDQPDTGGDVLGEKQWQWFEKQLKEEADLRIIVSGFQVLLNKDAGSETWDRFPEAKQHLFQTIRKSEAENVLFLTGDQHYGEVSRLQNALDYDAVELQFAGINQIEDPEFNPLRVSPVIQSKHSVAAIDIQLEKNKYDVPHILFRVADAITGQMELTYRLNFSEISLQLDFPSPRLFAEQQQIHLNHNYPNLILKYTLDGSEPQAFSTEYTQPFQINSETTVKARFFDQNQVPRSRTFEANYQKIKPQKSLQISQKLHNGLWFKYYEGNFERLPDFTQIRAKKIRYNNRF